VESESDRVTSALKEFRQAFCTIEYNQELNLDRLVGGEEPREHVEALALISSRQDIGERDASIAADFVLQLSSRLTDDTQRQAILEKAIKVKLAYAVANEDVATVGAFFDDLFYDVLSQKGDLSANPYLALREIQKATGNISIDDLARVNNLGIQRALYSLVAKFPEPERSVADCVGLLKRTGAVRALLVGVGEYNSPEMYDSAGPINDIELLKRTLEVREIEDIRLAVNITRNQLISQMRALVLDTDCGDSVVFHFSGWALPLDSACSDAKSACALKGWNLALALADTILKGRHNVLYAAELSQFITAIRNRGANVSMIIDTDNAAALNIVGLQKLANPPTAFWTGRLLASGKPVSTNRDLGSITAVHEGAGAFAVFYAADADHSAYEYKIAIPEQEPRVLGVFTYAVARVLQTSKNPTVRELLLAIDQEYVTELTKQRERTVIVEKDPPIPVLDASAPDMQFLGGQEPIEQGTLDIDILSPKLTRGVTPVRSSKIKIVGRLIDPQKYASLTIDLKPVQVASTGDFSVEIELLPGRQELQFVAIDYNFVFRTKKIEFELPDDLARVAREGKKYALIIGNQDYIDDHYRDLETPRRDAETIGNLLRDRYGFETAIQSSTGSVVDLTLLNATHREIHSTIRLLRSRLPENSTLVVYYAGHGVYQEDIDRAYWLPVDAEPDAEYTWIKATDLIDTLKQFAARNILVVADSCYSGAMAKRDVPDLESLDDDRRKALLKAATRKSRILISSGGTEPVLDGGGGAHSVFARAFITALKQMDKEIFSSQEMYSQFILPMVQGNENQEPQHKELEQSGHEGGDVIFWHTTVETTALQ